MVKQNNDSMEAERRRSLLKDLDQRIISIAKQYGIPEDRVKHIYREFLLVRSATSKILENLPEPHNSDCINAIWQITLHRLANDQNSAGKER
jgi:hypothetical protein